MSYVADSLVEGEEVRYQTTVSYWGYFMNMVIAVALLAGAWTLYDQKFPVQAPTYGDRIVSNRRKVVCSDG